MNTDMPVAALQLWNSYRETTCLSLTSMHPVFTPTHTCEYTHTCARTHTLNLKTHYKAGVGLIKSCRGKNSLVLSKTAEE